MFDLIVITAANEAQAKGYRAQTASWKNVVVIPDPGDVRVGSLGATVNALRVIDPSAKRILVCHSGGDARRTPGYAAMGKAFIPLKDGRALFEHIVEAMSQLPLPEDGGVVVVSGDVLPEFDYAAVDFSRPGVTGVAYPDGPEEARRHGVYVTGKAAPGESRGALQALRVENFLQKPDVHEGTHLIDTGVLFIDIATAGKMKALPVSGDIYDEFPKMLLSGFAPFSVNVVGEDCGFFHVGSTREILTKLGDGNSYVDGAGCKLDLEGGNVVTNVPRGRFKTLKLKRNECFTCIPYGRNKWLDLKYMLDDNFKSDGLWEKHKLADIMRRVDYARLMALRTRGSATDARRTVRVTAPVRIDFAGGWSDTPPICYNEGGEVANAAVTLDGVKPIEVTVTPRRDKFVKVVSKDLGKRRLVKSAQELADHSDPHDWCALVKSALAVTGFKFGSRGLDITISANLPKGSGMGTSSILGAATIAALTETTDAAVIGELTLRLEQEMRTGGGWQDQFGGIVGGAKLLYSRPGEPQEVVVKQLPVAWLSKLLAEKGLLYFTGQKRMARNVLNKVLAFYAANPHDFAKILVSSLKNDAHMCADAICEGDEATFAAAINNYWRDKKLLDAGSTNDRVEEMIESIRGLTEAVLLTGAGGGGFMFILANDAKSARKIRKILEDKSPTRQARFYSFAIDNEGLKLEVRN